ncbi:MAG: hypothetical protein EZS28_030617, partial [Streblomastix strix]
MQQEYKFYETARAIVSFTDSYTQNKQGKQNEQTESESTSSITKICSSLQFLRNQIWENNGCKQVIQIPKLLQSLTVLSRFKIDIHIGQELDNQRLKVRSLSRECFRWIQQLGDEQDQSELVNNGCGRVMSITFSTAGGKGEEQDEEIRNGLQGIFYFLRELHAVRNWQSSFQPLPLLARRTKEQIEEGGASEELENQSYYSDFITKHIETTPLFIVEMLIESHCPQPRLWDQADQKVHPKTKVLFGKLKQIAKMFDGIDDFDDLAMKMRKRKRNEKETSSDNENTSENSSNSEHVMRHPPKRRKRRRKNETSDSETSEATPSPPPRKLHKDKKRKNTTK